MVLRKGLLGPVEVTYQQVGVFCKQCEIWTGRPHYLHGEAALRHAQEKHPERFLAMTKHVLDTLLRGHDYSPYIEEHCLYDRIEREEKEKS